jgi:hypothetical protein
MPCHCTEHTAAETLTRKSRSTSELQRIDIVCACGKSYSGFRQQHLTLIRTPHHAQQTVLPVFQAMCSCADVDMRPACAVLMGAGLHYYCTGFGNRNWHLCHTQAEAHAAKSLIGWVQTLQANKPKDDQHQAHWALTAVLFCHHRQGSSWHGNKCQMDKVSNQPNG